MRSRALLAAAFATLLLVGAPPAAGAPGLGQVDPDDVRLAIHLEADGDGAWTVEYRIDLESDNETAAFEALQADIEENPDRFEADFAASIRESLWLAENRTGREMALRNVAVSTRTEPSSTFRGRGVVVYTFTWTNFARANGSHIRAGDALSGFYVDERTTLLLTWPDGYHPTALRPPDDTEAGRTGVAVWRGETEFSADEPRLTLSRATPTPSSTAASGGSGGEDGPLGSIPTAPVGAVAGTALALAGVGWVLRRRKDRTPTATGGADAGEGGEDAPPPELLSNEERILSELSDGGGRLKQQELADRLDWTAPKTSKVVGDLRDAGEVEVFRLGRENVVTLPGEGLTDE